MCFSATASFAAGTVLSAIGVATVARAERKSDKVFAAIPLFFGIQQLTEGVIWLSFGSPQVLGAMTFVFLLFSHVIWPTLIPLAVFLMERGPWRRRVLAVCIAVGAVVSAYFLYYLLKEQVRPEVLNKCIAYVSPHFSKIFVLSPYTVATCASCLVSSHRFVNLFGVVVFLSALVAYQFYEIAFISVWCFFAAILSLVIYAHFRCEHQISLKKA